MGEFDKILKENVEAVFLPMAEDLLGISIKKIFEVKDKVQTTVEREPDFLKRVIDQDGKEFPEGIPLVHIAVGVSDHERPEDDL